MKRTKIALAALLLTLAAVVALVAATAGTARRSDVFKVAWIYVGPHNDGGWSQAHDAGRLYVQKGLGSKVQTTYKENIAVGTQAKQTAARLVQQGYKMILGTSYGYFDRKLAGRLRLERAEVRAEVVADGGRLQLGPVLPRARQGGDGGQLEVGLLLRLDQGRLHRPRALRAKGLRGDEGEDRGEDEADRER